MLKIMGLRNDEERERMKPRG